MVKVVRPAGRRLSPDRYSATAVQENGTRRRRRKWSVQGDIIIIQCCYVKSIPEKKGLSAEDVENVGRQRNV